MDEGSALSSSVAPEGGATAPTVASASPDSGAVITTNYLKRTQTVVAVDKNDLEIILGFDLMEACSFGLGVFLVSGAGWLSIEKISEQKTFEFTNLLVICSLCIVFGAIAIGAGVWARHRKRKQILNIFNETEVVR